MDEGGESACWLDRVCDACGRLRERSGPGPCEHCGGGARATEGVPSDSERAEDERAEDAESPGADHRR
ncbi:hypothetical protein ABZW10_06850 [Kitasatospora sp. NPDC004723]|uniref:hypothetical protein n=1 Tax=Kitasatospora sp. NPDC004723 TaxID=3154288 RepID=UPI0033B9F96F